MKKTLLFLLLTTFSNNAQTATDYVTGIFDPMGLTFDNAGNLYVADSYNYKITKITPSLTKSTFASNLNGVLKQIAFDSNNNLWIAGSGLMSEVVKVNTSGAVTSTYPATSSPYGLAIDATGNIYYSEANSGNIIKISTLGVKTTFASGLTQPNGIIFDKADNLIVADKAEGKIKKITPNGTISTITSGISNPSNIVYAPNGDLYISTGSQGKIFKFPAGAVDGGQELYFTLAKYEVANFITIYNGALYVTNETKITKITDPALSIKENIASNNEVFIYPNPTSDFITINNLNPETKSIQLFDLSGKLVKSYNPSDVKNNTISLSGVVTGNYILKIDNSSKRIVVK